MSASNIRIATIGTWGHYGEVLSEMATMPQCQVVAHARAMPDDDPAVFSSYTNGKPPWFDDYHQMLREVRPDVVVIATRIDRINPIAIDAASAGCHLICEKPLAIEHADLRKLHEVVTGNKRRCIAMLGNGRHPVMQAAAGVLRSGQAGEVVLMNARKSYKWGSRPDWFGQRKCYGGTIGWVAIHALEMLHVLGNQSFTTVSAMQSNRAHPDRPDCQDNGTIMLGLSGGGSASVSFDYLRPRAASTHGDDWVRIVGTRGVIEASLDRNTCRFVSDELAEHDIPLPARGGYYAPFLQSLAADVPYPPAEMQRAFMLTHVSLCARDAAETGSVKAIPSFG
jgi:predicted dehydrogenase